MTRYPIEVAYTKNKGILKGVIISLRFQKYVYYWEKHGVIPFNKLEDIFNLRMFHPRVLLSIHFEL